MALYFSTSKSNKYNTFIDNFNIKHFFNQEVILIFSQDISIFANIRYWPSFFTLDTFIDPNLIIVNNKII
jgi:hypothetical protein